MRTTRTIALVCLLLNQQLWNGNAFSIQQQYRSQLCLNNVKTKTTTKTTTCSHQNQKKHQSKLYATTESNDDTKSNGIVSTTRNTIREEADMALGNVGWSMPLDGELTSTDPFVMAINDSIQNDYGVQLDQLLNPAKVVNLERDLYVNRVKLAELTGVSIQQQNQDQSSSTSSNMFLLTKDCDGGGGGEEADTLRKVIQKKENDLIIERRSVFRGWLKNIFLVQAIISFILSYVMASNPYSLFGQYSWYNYYNMDISISVLGYWWWWLFIIPSLRSRRPSNEEKNALDICFLLSPFVSIIAPIATKDTVLIWDANFAIVALSYLYAFVIAPNFENDDDNNDDNDDSNNTPSWLKFIYKSLDFGSGRERGARQ